MGPAGGSISAPKSIRLHYNVAVLTAQIERRRTIVSLANLSQNRQGKCLALEPKCLGVIHIARVTNLIISSVR
jgi:hypothetical protein